MKQFKYLGFWLLAATTLIGCSKLEKDLAKEERSAAGKQGGGNKAGPGAAKDKGVKPARTEREQRSPAPVRPEVPVKVAIIEEGTVTSSLVFDSVLETESSVEIFAESSGVILEVLVEEGDMVKEGQILARMENDTQRVDLEESLARYEHEKVNFKRTTDLYERKLINQQEFDSAKFALEQMRLRYERSKIQLENTIVRATVDGVITERFAQAGSRVSNNRQLFSIMNLDELFANVNIPGQHLLSVKKDLPAIIESELIAGVRYDAYVKLVSPVVDPGSGTFKAKVGVLQDGGMPIYPGMFVNVRIIVDTTENAVLVPKEAIVHEGDLKFIYAVKGGKARKIPLEEGYSNSGFVQATSGVDKGDSIIVVGQNALKDGANVKIVTDEMAAEQSGEERTTANQG